eukprot:TRINITY_DN2066_c0_g1_i3.p1 TRINITY_DN2066_c0_g1~~TRINITY_DN2066_c0_g1_i3.p1  ORF type:complete len:448 (-),score=125.01 TRINITY_DN2066_c0_g1_i3:86-1429(-)
MCEELWGEIGPSNSFPAKNGGETRNTTGLGKAEREDLCKLPQIPILEGPKLYQPQPQTQKVRREYQTDPVVQNNIRLLQYKRQLLTVLEALQQHKTSLQEGNGGAASGAQGDQPKEQLPPLPQAPVYPQLVPVTKPSKSNNNPTSLPGSAQPFKEEPDVKPDIGSEKPELSRSEYLSLLRRAVIKISAHAGYTNANESALCVLTETAENYIQNIARKLRAELDRSLECNEDGNGWSDILEKVLVESGGGGVLQLQEYYENYVIKYNTRLLAQCRELEEMYAKEMKICLESGQDNIPEMHFPSSDEGAGESLPNLATPTLDVGMQMLQSLEASGVDLGGEEPSAATTTGGPLSNQSEMAFTCPTPSPALTPRNIASCPTPSPAAAFTPRPLHAPSPQQQQQQMVVLSASGSGAAAAPPSGVSTVVVGSGGGIPSAAKKRRRSGGGKLI